MKKSVIILIFVVISFSIIHADIQNDFLNTLFYPFYDVMDNFVDDYSSLAGMYTVGGELKGAASIGSFPSFRVGATLGTIFFTNPFGFIKDFEINGTGFEQMIARIGPISTAVDWFDTNFIPMPIANYHFHVGLPKGLTVGVKFNIGPIGAIVNGIYPNDYINEFLHWSVGGSLTYTILKEYKMFPTIGVTGGVQYSNAKVGLGVPAIPIKFDSTNEIKTEIGFNTEFRNIAVYFDFAISKNFIFFQPFINFKFAHTVAYNETKIFVDLDLSNATTELKNTIQNIDHIEISNLKNIDPINGQAIGIVVPLTDFIVSGGFEFVMKIFRLGVEGSYGVVSKKGMVTVGMRFHVEKWQFEKLKK